MSITNDIANGVKSVFYAVDGNTNADGVPPESASDNPANPADGECGVLCTVSNGVQGLWGQYTAMVDGFTKSEGQGSSGTIHYERKTFGTTKAENCKDYRILDTSNGNVVDVTFCGNTNIDPLATAIASAELYII